MGKHAVPPTKHDPHHHDNPTPPPGPLSNQECDCPSPQVLSRLGRRVHTHTPYPQAWSLAPGSRAVLETTARAGRPRALLRKPGLGWGQRRGQSLARTPGSCYQPAPHPLRGGKQKKKNKMRAPGLRDPRSQAEYNNSKPFPRPLLVELSAPGTRGRGG